MSPPTTTTTTTTTTTPPPPPPTYKIGHGEKGVLTHEPYKSTLLPFWRFATVEAARVSSEALWTRFCEYDGNANGEGEGGGDFVGMDMARKFIQMGMTRSKRYANYKGGRKFDYVFVGGGTGDGDGDGDASTRGSDEGANTKTKKKKGGVMKEDTSEQQNVDQQQQQQQQRVIKKKIQRPKSQDHKGHEKNEEVGKIFAAVLARCKAHEGYRRRKEAFLKMQRVEREKDRKREKEKEKEKDRKLEKEKENGIKGVKRELSNGSVGDGGEGEGKSAGGVKPKKVKRKRKS